MMTQGSVLSNAALANALLGGGANVGPYGVNVMALVQGRPTAPVGTAKYTNEAIDGSCHKMST
jgi:hypothetical protein